MRTILTLLIFSIAVFIVSCSDKTGENKDHVVPCVTIDECDNGLLCINGFCGKEVHQSECINDDDCPRGFECNAQEECVMKTCETKEDCGIGSICSNQTCIPGCETNQDCKDGKICNTNTNVCEDDNKVDCRLNDTCEQGYECDQLSGDCKLNTTCNTDEDCGDGAKCDNHTCIPRTACVAENNGAECAENEICRPDGFCGIDNGCTDDNYCMNLDPTKPICNTNSGICYECLTDEHCTDDKKCDTTRYVCGDAQNLTCVTDQDCGLNRKCQEDGTCISAFGAECTSDADCTDLTRGKCLTSADPHRCVQCLQDDQCETAQICNANTYLCEDQGSGTACTDDSECNALAGESCVNGQCYNPNASGNDGAEGVCDLDYGGTMCVLFGGSCNGDLLTNEHCSLSPLDIWCGDCVFDE